MSELVIKDETGFVNIPVSDVGDPADYSLVQQMPVPVEFGTDANKKRIWSSGQAYLDAYHYVDTQGYHHYNLDWNPLAGWSPDPPPPYVTSIGNVDEILIGCAKSGNNAVVSWSVTGIFPNSNGILFNGTYAALEPDLSEVRDWDESPTDDENNPFGDNPMGGEYADTDPFGFGNDDIDLPETIQEMDYSGFITPYKIDNGGLFALAGGIFSTDTWTTLKNKFNGVGNPIDYIVSAVEIPYSASADDTKNFNLGGVDVVNGNGGNVPLPYFTHRYEKLSFGSLTLKETWGTERTTPQQTSQFTFRM